MQTENNSVPCNLQQNTLPTPPAVSQGKPQPQTGRLNVHEPNNRPRVSWTEARIIDGILFDDDLVSRCLLALYKRQTRAEKEHEKAIAANRVGFSKANAAAFGRMAETLLAGRPLSGVELHYCRELLQNGLPRLAKHRKQLLGLLNQPAETCDAETDMASEVLQ